MKVGLTPLTLEDRRQFSEALSAMANIQRAPLASYAWAPHMIWRRVFKYYWCKLNEWMCIFARYSDGLFMPLPPLGPCSTHYAEALSWAFTFMTEENRGSRITRIENIPEELKDQFDGQEYQLRPKDPDYLYNVADLISLKGNPYKSQRAACRRFVRNHEFQYRPYEKADKNGCLAVLRLWTSQKTRRGRDSYRDTVNLVADQMIQDSQGAHSEGLEHYRELGLLGRVVEVEDTIQGYTFGYERNPQVFCVLLEVTDRAIPGLAQFLFREFCREFHSYHFINTMDDSGLAGLAQSKKLYRPVRLVPSYIATTATEITAH